MDRPPLRVLLVEDLDADAFLTTRYLRKVDPDAVVERVETAEEGLARLAEGGFDLVLCHHRLSAMSGIDFVRSARIRHADLPIVILAGHGDEEIAAAALRAGASDYLPKTRLTEESLAVAIRHALAAHAGERARRAAEAALLASEERYRGLFARSVGGMFRLAADGRVLDCNPASARILGYATTEEVQAHNALEFFADPAEAGRLIERIRHERILTNVEITFRRPDDQRFPVLMNAWIADIDGVKCFEGQFLDIGDRSRAEAAEREATALRTVTQLANAASHEINNPLSVIMGSVTMLADAAGPDAPGTARMARIRDAVARIRDVVARLTHITRIEVDQSAGGGDNRLKLPDRID
jgi:PAS domain S-box-containing protein